MFAALERAVALISRIMAAIAGLALLAIALLVMLEVTMREIGTPLVGGIELMRVTFVVSVFFAFAHVVVTGREIRVDALRQLFHGRLGHVLDAFASLVTLAFFLFFVVFGSLRLHDTWTNGVFLDGRLLIPMSIPWGSIVAGSALAAVAAALQAVGHALRAAGAVAPAGNDLLARD